MKLVPRIYKNMAVTILVLVLLLLPTASLFSFFGEQEAVVSEELAQGDRKEESNTAEIKPAAHEYTAFNLKDPFEDFFASRAKESVKKKSVETEISLNPPALTVQGLVWGGKTPQAIINDKVVKKGDNIEGAEIIDIGKDGVSVRYNGQIFKLSSPAPAAKGAVKEEVTQ